MDYKKYYDELLDTMLNSNDIDLERLAKRIKKKVLRIAVEEEFKLGLEKVQTAVLISSKDVIEQARIWFGYDVTADNWDSNMCYDFIKANDYDRNHVKFIKDNWDDINDVFSIIRTKLDNWYWECLQIEDKELANKNYLDPNKEDFDYENDELSEDGGESNEEL